MEKPSPLVLVNKGEHPLRLALYCGPFSYSRVYDTEYNQFCMNFFGQTVSSHAAKYSIVFLARNVFGTISMFDKLYPIGDRPLTVDRFNATVVKMSGLQEQFLSSAPLTNIWLKKACDYLEKYRDENEPW